MKLFVITVTYNSADTITECIVSAHQQNSNYTHVFVDGASTDGTVDTIRKYMRPHDILISEADKGIYDALNKAFTMVEDNSIVGILHSDDVYANENIHAKVLSCFCDRPCDIVYGDLAFISSTSSQSVVRYWYSGKFSKKALKYGAMPPHPTIFTTTAVLKNVGYFDLRFRISADYDYIMRMSKFSEYKWVYLREVITIMKIGGASTSGIKSFVQKTKEDYSILKLHNFRWPMVVLFQKKVRKIVQYFPRFGK